MRCRRCDSCIRNLALSPNQKLVSFLKRFLQLPLANIISSSPLAKGTVYYDYMSAVPIYEEDAFQVELVCMRGPHTFTVHRHPNLDSILIYVTGNLAFFYGPNKSYVEDMTKAIHGIPPMPDFLTPFYIDSDTWHVVRTDANGGSFLNVQHWLTGTPKTAGEAWDGVPMGLRHYEKLNS